MMSKTLLQEVHVVTSQVFQVGRTQVGGDDFQPWKDLVPKCLRPGDVVRLVLYVDSGDLEIFVNGASQARWLGDLPQNSDA